MLSWLKSRKTASERGLDGKNSVPKPDSAMALDDLESALEAGDLARAVELVGAVSPVQRAGAQYFRLEGWLAYALGNRADALKWLERAVQVDQGCAHAHALLAAIHMQQGRPEAALASANAAEANGGAYAWLRSMLGVLHHERGEPELARSWFSKALELDPARLDAVQALAVLAYGDQDWGELASLSRVLVSGSPEDPKFWSYLGTAEARQGTDEEADRCFQRAIDISQGSVEAERDYAAFLINCGRVEEARVHLERGLERDPHHPLLHTAHAQCVLILDGSNPEAWSEYEWRLQLLGAPRSERADRWRGERLSPGTLHITGEQGIGDMLLFARFLPEVIKRCDRVVLELPTTLVTLFKATALRCGWERLEVIPKGAPVHTVGPCRTLHFMSLMDVLGPQLPTISAPYLLPAESLEQHWAARLGQRASRKRVALVWAGNPQREDDVLRSIPPAMLAPLAAVPSVEFVSLQKDAHAKYTGDLPVRIRDVTPEVRDFADSAAVLRQCDLLISIDTAAAHLAGACGVPCRVLLPRGRDWRWELAGVDQPWYGSTHRSFRVDRSRDWQPVIEEVASELHRCTAEP